MSNQSSSDLFNNFEIPAFDAGTTVPAQTHTKEITTTASQNDLLPIYIGSGIAVFIILVLLALLLKKKKKEDTYVQEIESEKEEIETKRPQAIEIRSKKETNNFATPINLNQCIRLFLENTRIK